MISVNYGEFPCNTLAIYRLIDVIYNLKICEIRQILENTH